MAILEIRAGNIPLELVKPKDITSIQLSLGQHLIDTSDDGKRIFRSPEELIREFYRERFRYLEQSQWPVMAAELRQELSYQTDAILDGLEAAEQTSVHFPRSRRLLAEIAQNPILARLSLEEREKWFYFDAGWESLESVDPAIEAQKPAVIKRRPPDRKRREPPPPITTPQRSEYEHLIVGTSAKVALYQTLLRGCDDFGFHQGLRVRFDDPPTREYLTTEMKEEVAIFYRSQPKSRAAQLHQAPELGRGNMKALLLELAEGNSHLAIAATEDDEVFWAVLNILRGRLNRDQVNQLLETRKKPNK